MERETFEIGTFHNYGTRGQRGRQILRVFINMEHGGRGDQQVFRVFINMKRGVIKILNSRGIMGVVYGSGESLQPPMDHSFETRTGALTSARVYSRLTRT
jgi:hypothetical protein